MKNPPDTGMVVPTAPPPSAGVSGTPTTRDTRDLDGVAGAPGAREPGARDTSGADTEIAGLRARLRASEGRFAALAAASGQMVWTARADGQVDDAPGWRAYAGTLREGPTREGQVEEAARGRGWLDGVHPEDRPAALAEWTASLIMRRVYDVECRLRRSDGVYRWMRVRAVPRIDAGGVLREWIGTCDDIHEARSRAEESARALRDAQRRMDEFVGIASHELRTPLTVIYANLQLLATRLGALATASATGQPPALDLSQRLDGVLGLALRGERHAQRLNRLVGDLLDVARIHEGKLEPRPERCDLLGVVREAVEAQRMVWPGRTIHLNLPAGRRSIVVLADPSRIEQVVANFLSNALKYSPPGRPVTVRVRTERGDLAGHVRVAVRDRGLGLPPEERDRVWGRYYRAEGVAERSGSAIGLGLGLYISRTIVEHHGGLVGVEGTPGEGSTFWFTLPLAGPSA